MSEHNCPACGCYFGMLGITGGFIPGTTVRVEGLVDKNIRLASELRRVKQELQRRDRA